MPQRKENDGNEAKPKDIFEHAYNAGMSTLSAFRAMVPKVPANSKAYRDFRNAQRELLLAMRSVIDNQINFLEHLDKISKHGSKGETIKKVQVKEKE